MTAGLATAQYNLGVMYANGEGVTHHRVMQNETDDKVAVPILVRSNIYKFA